MGIFTVGGKYNWKHQQERLVYLGQQGCWYQFALVDEPEKVWCEILLQDCHHIEDTLTVDN